MISRRTDPQLLTISPRAVQQVGDALAAFETRFTAAEDERRVSAGESHAKADERFQTLMADLEHTRGNAEEVLRLAGGAALSQRWIAQARKQILERAAWVAAVAAIMSFTLYFGFSHLDQLTAPGDYSFVQALVFYLPRLPLAIVVITALGFAVQQASKRAQWEARDRRVGNELTAFPSFLTHVPDGERGDVAKQVALRYFPGPELRHDEPGTQSVGEPERLLGIDAKVVASLAPSLVLGVVLLYLLAN